MHTSAHPKRFVWRLGLLCFALQLVLSIWFYQARAGTMDNAFQIVLLTVEEDITIMAHRWPAVVVRAIPLLLVQVKAPLWAVMMSFSLSYLLLQFLFFVLLVRDFKAPRIALVQLAVLLLACSGGFYWCNSEQVQGFSALLLLWGLWEREGDWAFRHWFLLAFLLVAVLFYHPLMLFPFVFLGLWRSVYHLKLHLPDLLLTGIFAGLWFLKRRYIINSYDANKTKDFMSNVEQYWQQFWNIPAFEQFVGELFSKYHFILLGLLLVTVFLVQQRRWLALIFVYVYNLGYLAVVFFGGPGLAESFYAEINYYGLVLFLYFPLLKEAPTHFWKIPAFRWSLTAVFMLSLLRITLAAGPFQARYDWVKETVAEQKCGKTLIKSEDIPEEISLLEWGIPYEALLHSVGAPESKSLHVLIPDKLEKGNYQAGWFVTSLQTLPPGYLNNHYLRFPKGPYCWAGTGRLVE